MSRILGSYQTLYEVLVFDGVCHKLNVYGILSVAEQANLVMSGSFDFALIHLKRAKIEC
ncbi:hypothetical protein ACMXYO_05100 [Neptuniibacter sp. QD37_6]|uniref:hypothetical protein n=1 Tax=Neptuniibacter sp. QD37_6 TaxID=3398210 RepID=UPI0039F5AEB6